MIEGLVSELLNGEMSLVRRWRDGIRSQLYILLILFSAFISKLSNNFLYF